MLRRYRALFLSPAGAGLLFSALLSACGSAAVPAGKLTNTQGTIRAAEEVGAERTPQAALHLKLARDQLAQAERLIREGDTEEAELVLNQAQADADLAVAHSHETNAKREAQEARARVDRLRSEGKAN